MNALADPLASFMTESQLVFEALDNPDYLWRSAEGISDETHLPLDTVKQIILIESDQLIRSIVPDDKGHPLYTTPQHYRAHAGILRRALSALSDQVR
jgi:hypothetical protein